MTKKRSPINGKVKKAILVLNHKLPEEKSSIWVTVEEMHSRLVHSGVRPSLTIDMVSSALLTANRGECIITKRQFYNCLYYIPTSFADNDELPNDQRFKGRGGRGKRIHGVKLQQRQHRSHRPHARRAAQAARVAQ